MKSILFIEDESALQKTFGDLLGSRGYKVISALDGEIGLALAKKERPDLILLDIVLPKVSGLEVLTGLKENPETKKIPIVILTNLEGMDNVGKALELGAMTYLVKSQYNLNEVIEKIEKALMVQ
jgi:DNA-binding response OmpR family regulator